MSEDFTWWRAQLAGKNPELDDKLPRVGFYRKVDDPVMIRVVDRVMWAWIGRKGAQRAVKADDSFAETTFSFFCRNAITSEVYEAVANNAAPWPDDIESLDEQRSNFPTDPFEALIAELELLEMKISEFLKTPMTVGDEVRALQADKWKVRARKVEDAIETMREAKRKPLNEELKEIQRVFVAGRTRAESLVSKISAYVAPHVLAKKRKVEAEEAAARDAQIKAAQAMGEPAPPPAAPARGRSKVASGSTTVRTYKVPVITDIKAAAAFYAGLPNPPRPFVEVIEDMAERNIKGGIDVPGVHLETRERVS